VRIAVNSTLGHEKHKKENTYQNPPDNQKKTIKQAQKKPERNFYTFPKNF